MPGEEGIWVVVLGDLVVFGFFFATILSLRLHHGALVTASQRELHHGLGLLNTILLLSSSWLVAEGVHAVQRGEGSRRPFLLAAGCGFGFIAVKALEYTSLITAGHTPAENAFFQYYFVFTGIHLLHLVVGLLALGFMSRVADRHLMSGRQGTLLESAGIFWHLVDVLWLVLFPLLYLVR